MGANYVLDGAGCICIEVERKEGGEPVTDYEPLANFSAIIKTDIVIDDGAEVSRVFEIDGRLEGINCDGRRELGPTLPTIRVPAGDFASLKWIQPQWGAKPRIFARENYPGMVREAIQALSAPVEKRVYGFTGWSKIADKWTYLHAGGGINADGPVPDITVELPGALARFRLPDEPTEVAAAVRASLSIFGVAPLTATAPLLGAAYASVVSSILRPNFLVHVVGQTGSRKSTLAALCMQHFGAEFGSSTGATVGLPLHWMSTYASIEDAMFRAKDAMLVVDDYKHQHDGAAQRKLEGKAGDVIRAIGDRVGKSRSTWRGERGVVALPSKPPRALCVSTGEIMFPGHSDVGRVVQVSLEHDAVKLDKLSAVQAASDRLPHAMSAFVRWVAQRYDALAAELPARHAKLAQEMRDDDDAEHAHTRQPGALAHLLIGIELMTRFAVDVGAQTEVEATLTVADARAALLELTEAQNETSREANPAERFMDVLRILVATGKAKLADKSKKLDEHAPWDTAHLIGWRDAEHAYVLADEALRLVTQFERDSGRNFPCTKGSLLPALVKLGYATPKTESEGKGKERERIERKEWVGGGSRRVLMMPLVTAELTIGLASVPAPSAAPNGHANGAVDVAVELGPLIAAGRVDDAWEAMQKAIAAQKSTPKS